MKKYLVFFETIIVVIALLGRNSIIFAAQNHKGGDFDISNHAERTLFEHF
jgi:hypothetical protein